MEQKTYFSTSMGILGIYALRKEIPLRKEKQTISLPKDHSFQKALEMDGVSGNKRF